MRVDPLHEPLLRWYTAERRDLPWRRTSDPYAIWVSEIMLQQTQVATVIPYYHRWLERFPNVRSLAEADEQAILSAWQGLGYYRRARLLQAGARYVLENGVPSTAAEWRRVPGVGPYTAGAIASIALGEPAPLVDGNVERVVARVLNSRKKGAELNRQAWEWAAVHLHREQPGDWNQALMELGATICRPERPDCPRCPWEALCAARQAASERLLPLKEDRTKTVSLAFDVWVVTHGGRIGLRQIPPGEWWEGMWECPRAPAADGENPTLRNLVGPGWVQTVGIHRHAVTHHRIRLIVGKVEAESADPSLRWFLPEELGDLPLPSPQRRVLEMAGMLPSLGKTPG